MAHPHQEHRAHKVEKERVHELYGHKMPDKAGTMAAAHDVPSAYAKGGRVNAPKAFADGGAVAKPRADKRARGGGTKHKKGTTINIVNSGGHPAMPGPMAGIGAAPPMIAPRPPMPAVPPGMPPGGPPSLAPTSGPPGAPMMRTAGGRAYAKGGAVKSGPSWDESIKAGTKPHNSPGKNDIKDIGRGKAITYNKGGAVPMKMVSFMARARGGAIESPQGVDPKTKLPGGSGGGEARLAKEKREKKDFHAKSKLES